MVQFVGASGCREALREFAGRQRGVVKLWRRNQKGQAKAKETLEGGGIEVAFVPNDNMAVFAGFVETRWAQVWRDIPCLAFDRAVRRMGLLMVV